MIFFLIKFNFQSKIQICLQNAKNLSLTGLALSTLLADKSVSLWSDDKNWTLKIWFKVKSKLEDKHLNRTFTKKAGLFIRNKNHV